MYTIQSMERPNTSHEVSRAKLSQSLPRGWKQRPNSALLDAKAMRGTKKQRKQKSLKRKHQSARPSSRKGAFRKERPHTSGPKYEKHTSFVSKSHIRMLSPMKFGATYQNMDQMNRKRQKAALWNLSGLAEQNNAEQLESLFKAGESVLSLIDFREIDGCTPFLRAAKHGSLDALKALTAAGANVEVADNCGLTAFHLAAEGGRTEILQYLCSDEGRDLFPDFNGMFKAVSKGVEWSAIHYAAERGHASACRVLLENGASASPRSKKLWTPLMLAASHGHREAIEALLPYACDLGATDPRTFESALHLACKNGFHASARLLLEAGCRMTLDWQGRTPLAHALGNNFPWDVAVTPLQALPSMQTKLVRLQQDFVAADEARIAAEAELRRTKQQLEAIRAEFNQSQLEIYRLRHVDHSGDANKHELSKHDDKRRATLINAMLDDAMSEASGLQLLRAFNAISADILPVLHQTKRKKWQDDWHHLHRELNQPRSLTVAPAVEVPESRPRLELLGTAMRDSSCVGLVWRALANGRFPVEVLCVPGKGGNATGIDAWRIASSSPCPFISPMLYSWVETAKELGSHWGIGETEMADFALLPEGSEVVFALRPIPGESVRWWWAERVAEAMKHGDFRRLRLALVLVIQQTLLATAHLQRHNICHRNVTAESVYVFGGSNSLSRESGSLSVRLSDFQSATAFNHTQGALDVFYFSRAQLLERANPAAASPEVAHALWKGPREGEGAQLLRNVLAGNDAFSVGRMWVSLAMSAQALIDGKSVGEGSSFVMPKAREFEGEIPYASLGKVATELLVGEGDGGSLQREVIEGLLKIDPCQRMDASVAAAKLGEVLGDKATVESETAIAGPATRITRELLSALLQKKLVVH